MIGNVNPPPGGPADGFDAPANPWGACGRGRDSTQRPRRRPTMDPVVRPCRAMRTSGTVTSRTVLAQASKISDRPSTPNMPRSSPSTVPEPATYEQALAELESLVQAMEAGKMPLDQVLASYKRGAELLSFCRRKLEAVEAQVKLLEDGRLKPWTGA